MRLGRLVVGAWLCLTAFMFFAPTASAQGASEAATGCASPAEIAAARQLYNQGVDAAGGERWAEAVELFERSYRLCERPLTLLNLAASLPHLNRLVESIQLYRTWLARANSRSIRQHGDRVENEIHTLEARLGHVVIELSGGALNPSDQLRLDDQPVGSEVLGVRMEVDPGEHAVRLTRGAETCSSQAVTVPEGADQHISVEVCPDSVLPPEQIDTDSDGIADPADRCVTEPEDRDSYQDEDGCPDAGGRVNPFDTGAGGDGTVPVLIGVGVGVAVATAVIVTVIVATSNNGSVTQQPYCGSLMWCAEF